MYQLEPEEDDSVLQCGLEVFFGSYLISMVCQAAVNKKEVILKESHKTVEQVLRSLIRM